MRIAEIYHSIQGEGLLTGTESVFVRASGCNLRCWFCDTPYASWHPEGEDLEPSSVLARVCEWDAPHVVLTGGEPMLFAELIPLTELLANAGRHITIETAGTLDLPVSCHLMSISPKLSNSTPAASTVWARRHERTRHAPQVIRRLVRDYPYQLKFVVEQPVDGPEVLRWLDAFPEIDRGRVMLMPQGTTADHLEPLAEWLIPYCASEGLRYCPRRQIEWFGLVRGT